MAYRAQKQSIKKRKKPVKRSGIRRVEQQVITTSSPLYALVDDYCFRAKNVYNATNYICRQQFFSAKTFPDKGTLLKRVPLEPCYDEFKGLARTFQEIVNLVFLSWKSYEKLEDKYRKDPASLKGEPRIPRYKHKVKGRAPISFTYQQLKESGGYISFPQEFCLDGKPVKIKSCSKGALMQVRIIPKTGYYVLEIIRLLPLPKKKSDNGRYLGIDPGVDNACAVASNCGLKPLLVSGRALKTINQMYNKLIAEYRAKWDKLNKDSLNRRFKELGLPYKKSSKRIDALQRNRVRRIDSILHKISRLIADYAEQNNICKIVIGKNVDWKQGAHMGKVTNQNFVCIPIARLIEMITYKAEEYGIEVITIDEKHTSGTSFWDGEEPTKQFYNKSRRVTRGLFKAGGGKLINADINAACQIIKKALPNAFAKHTLRVNGSLGTMCNAGGSVEGICGNPVSLRHYGTYESVKKALLSPVRLEAGETSGAYKLP